MLFTNDSKKSWKISYTVNIYPVVVLCRKREWLCIMMASCPCLTVELEQPLCWLCFIKTELRRLYMLICYSCLWCVPVQTRFHIWKTTTISIHDAQQWTQLQTTASTRETMAGRGHFKWKPTSSLGFWIWIDEIKSAQTWSMIRNKPDWSYPEHL